VTQGLDLCILFNLHFIKMINTKYYCIWSIVHIWKQDVLCIIISFLKYFQVDFVFIHKFTNHAPRVLYVKYHIIWNASSSEFFFKNSPNFTPFFASVGASPLIFTKLNSHSPKMLIVLPYLVQISSVVLEKKSFKGKIYRRMNGQQTGHDHYISHEPLGQVS